MPKVLKRVGIGLMLLVGSLVAIVAATVVVAGLLYRANGRERTGAGAPHISSSYLTMNDGTRIAVEVALPKDLQPGQRIPTLIKGTPYWRSPQLTLPGAAFAELGLLRGLVDSDVPLLNERGYAVITVDARGTGASFGHAPVMFDDREVSDFGEVIDWAARQSWSNGRVGAYGFSYRGVLAVDMASLGRPALKAIAPSFDFPDLYLTAYPGGVFSQRFIKSWSEQTAAINRGEIPLGFVARLLIVGPQRVDSDKNGSLLADAIADHAGNWNVYDCVRRAPDRDDKICNSGKSLTDVSEIARQAATEKFGVPMHVMVGWFDANSAAQALERFQNLSNPEELTVGALSHGGFLNTNPFAGPRAPADPSYSRQVSEMADFFDLYLKRDGKPAGKLLHYFVLHGGGWKTTETWPPPGVKGTPWYLSSDKSLSATAPTRSTEDTYAVDFTATTGRYSRYQSPVDLSRTYYPDRATQDRKLLTYTSAPLAEDIEISGNPVAKLTLASTATDGEVIVYLEDVGADGTVTYLSEGPLRLAFRKVTTATSATISDDPLHTYLSADKAPMTPGKPESIEIELFPIAARLRKGERIRIAIAGADAGNLERLPATGSERLTIECGGIAPSLLVLPELASPE